MKLSIALVFALICVQSSASSLDNFILKNSPPILTISSNSAGNNGATACSKSIQDDIFVSGACPTTVACTFSSGSVVVTIRNTGGAATGVLQVSFTSTSSSYLLNPNTCEGIKLQPNATCVVDVHINIGCPGSLSTLTVTDGTASITIPLTGV